MNKYIIPIILIFLGILMSTDIAPIQNSYIVSCLNLSAFLLTVSCINLGSIKSSWRNYLSKGFKTVLQILAAISFLVIIIDESSSYYKTISEIVMFINSNSLLLIGLSATLISIYLNEDFNKNQQKNAHKQIEQLKGEIKKLENKYLNLKSSNVNLKEKQKELVQTNKELNEKFKEVINSMKNDRK